MPIDGVFTHPAWLVYLTGVWVVTCIIVILRVARRRRESRQQFNDPLVDLLRSVSTADTAHHGLQEQIKAQEVRLNVLSERVRKLERREK